ncbi:MAG: hypothetical protein CMO44_15725 [Verrucomicrobiales bacterium]|nr:hypothetical protein [Verrucomicrobiales bacterium]|tara:strand:- start:728 stop:994 length:267 start_codon:yes stop_codon:yes gene_type:complete
MALRDALVARNRAVIVENIAVFRTIIERSSNIDNPSNIIDQLDDCLQKISLAQDKINTLERMMPLQRSPGDEQEQEEQESPPTKSKKK